MIKRRHLSTLLEAVSPVAILTAVIVASTSMLACTIKESRGPYQPGTTRSYVAVGSGQTFAVRGYPPAPLRERITAAPGTGYVWIDGYWHWYGSEWQWRGGHWVADRPGFVYVSPYYEYGYAGYSYRTGYWVRRHRLGSNIYIHRPRGSRPLTGYARPPRRPGTLGPRHPGEMVRPPAGVRRYPGRFRPPRNRVRGTKRRPARTTPARKRK